MYVDLIWRRNALVPLNTIEKSLKRRLNRNTVEKRKKISFYDEPRIISPLSEPLAESPGNLAKRLFAASVN